MSNTLIQSINSHIRDVIREAYFTGLQSGLEIGRRVLNGTSLTKEEQEKETMKALKEIEEKFLLKEDNGEQG